MIQSEKLKAHAKRLRLYNIANRMDSILHHAQEEKPTYPEFLFLVFMGHRTKRFFQWSGKMGERF